MEGAKWIGRLIILEAAPRCSLLAADAAKLELDDLELERAVLVENRELQVLVAHAADASAILGHQGSTCTRSDGTEGMGVGRKHAQRRCACHKRRRARAGAEGGAVGAPSARRMGGASWQPFTREPTYTM